MATSESLPYFREAQKAGQRFVGASVRARDAQYRFLGLIYLAQLEGLKRPRLFKQMVKSCLGRSATKPEEKRPFLLILHAIIGTEDEAPRNALPQFSRLTSALEVIENAFHGVKPPKVDDLVAFIRDAGGVGGLYDLSRVGASDGTVTSSPAGTQNVVDLKPTDIDLPLLGAHVTKVGRGYRLRLSEWHPGEYQVLLRVGRGGFVQAIVDESADNEDAA